LVDVFICTAAPRRRLYAPDYRGDIAMKKSRGGRMTAAKARAAKRKGGKGPVSKRAAGKNIMKT
jgi:hypothetical protein